MESGLEYAKTGDFDGIGFDGIGFEEATAQKNYYLDLVERLDTRLEELKEQQILALKADFEAQAAILGMTVEGIMTTGDPKKGVPKRTPKGFPKYRNPNDPTQTWTGRGKRPRWLLTLVEAGRDIRELELTAPQF